MLDSVPTGADKPPVNPEVNQKLSAASASGGPGTGPAEVRTATDDAVKSGTLPVLTIDGADKGGADDSHWYSGALAVTKDLAKGAYDEVTEHPGHVLESAATGLAIGVGFGVAAVLAPEAAAAIGVGAIVGGIAYGGYELYEHGGALLHDTKVVASQKDYSQPEVSQAHLALQHDGAVATDVAAGAISAQAGAVAGGLVADEIADATTGATAYTTP
jgi:hypothetical protein